MISEAYYHFYRAKADKEKISQPVKIEFDPFPDGCLPSDAKNFKTTFIGIDHVLRIEGQPLSEFVKDHLDQDLLLTKERIRREIEKPTTSEESRAVLDDVLDRLDQEIRITTEHNVSKAFDTYLSQRLNPQGNLSDKGLKLLKERITTLFSSKALTAFFFSALNPYTQRKYGGVFLASAGVNPEQTCDLIIPEDPKAPIQMIAKVNTVYRKFLGNKGIEELSKPIHLDAEALYTIKRNAEVSAQAKITLFTREANR